MSKNRDRIKMGGGPLPKDVDQDGAPDTNAQGTENDADQTDVGTEQSLADVASEDPAPPDMVGRGYGPDHVPLYQDGGIIGDGSPDNEDADDDGEGEVENSDSTTEKEDTDDSAKGEIDTSVETEDTDKVSDIAEENAQSASSKPTAITLDVTPSNGDNPTMEGLTSVKIYRTQNIEIPAVAADIAADKYQLPKKATLGSSGYDLAARIRGTKFGDRIVLRAGDIIKIPTGFSFDIPSGYEFQVRPRSGLALKGISVVNAPGTIDCDYKDEVQVILRNNTTTDFTIEDGDRIAQLVFARVEGSILELGDIATRDLSDDRGGGFGHTGVAPLGADTTPAASE